MRLPRVGGPECGWPVAAGPVGERLSKGRVRQHDAPGQERAPGQPRVSCDGSLVKVDLPHDGQQLEIAIDEPVPEEPQVADAVALF